MTKTAVALAFLSLAAFIIKWVAIGAFCLMLVYIIRAIWND